MARSVLNRFARNDTGNIAVTFALSATVLVALAGGTIDFSVAHDTQRRLQEALDVSVLSGLRYEQSTRSENATRIFRASVGNALSITPNYTTDKTSLTGKVSYQSPTVFLGLIGVKSLGVQVTSTAVGTATKSGPCIQVLDPTANQSLLVNSGANVIAPDCEIQVRSTANPAAIFNSGSKLNFSKVCVEGKSVIQNATSVSGLSLSCNTEPDAWLSSIPAVASSPCTTSNGNFDGATVNLSPGVYCGWFNFNNGTANVNFAPVT